MQHLQNNWRMPCKRRWLFGSEVYVDVASLQRLRQLYGMQDAGSAAADAEAGTAAEPRLPPPSERAALVYVAAHKSHVDYLMLRCGLVD